METENSSNFSYAKISCGEMLARKSGLFKKIFIALMLVLFSALTFYFFREYKKGSFSDLDSFTVFLISRKYGSVVMQHIFSEKRYNKCQQWINKRTEKLSVILWFLLLIPFSPDDFICYCAGLTEMKFKKFMVIILTVKPWLIIFYGILFGYILD